MQTSRILIIGGGYAGTAAALRLARKTRGQPVEITLINGADTFVERIRLHQLAAGQQPARIPFRRLLKNSGVRFINGWVTSIRPDDHTVTLETAGSPLTLPYDYLIYAPGSRVDLDSVPGVRQHALSLDNEASTLALQHRLAETAAAGGRLLVIGGGLSGIESASELAEAYPRLKITLVTRGQFGSHLSAAGQTYLRQAFERRNIDVIDHHEVTRLNAASAETVSRTIPFDLALWAGAFTAPSLGRDSGFPVNAPGQVTVDDHLRALSHPDVYAIGDAADLNRALPFSIRMACATALPMGTYAADQITAVVQGKPQGEPYRFKYFTRCISLGRHDALVQWVDADDTPQERITTGRQGALIKEAICRGTIWQIQYERWLTPGLRVMMQPDAAKAG